MNTTNSLTDADLTAQILVVLKYGKSDIQGLLNGVVSLERCWQTTDQLLKVTAGRADRGQLLRVLFAMHDAGSLSYKRDLGWRLAAN